ncbi:hypothetical protein F7Q99_08805 [Streptomyces kaniharaensis]|uniref:Uncharacterized protein n=1 Tax=Streptomyces kaniharaensis TaxID=212423 RepID=A0A6N7KRX8_9ACTN|nr:hypothetical protein [Streptomyces kaniharaensis]MQS12383.1 hypothetical protein [Streptomyces kaniharaensis]
MVTFAQLRQASFDSLDHAGDTWSGVSGHVEQLGSQVRSGVLHPLAGGGPYSSPSAANRPWTGAAANEAVREIELLADELHAFHFEALAISAALHRAKTAFAEAKQNLLRAIGDAEALGATVAEGGAVTLPGLPPEERNDPEAIAYQKRKWDEVQHHVQVMTAAVAAATEADSAMATALRALNPEEVDPATHPDGVQNAKDDVIRAIGMPGDRKDVPGWWAALDPAVRAQLLEMDPNGLVAKGVLDPTYQWRAPNDGAGPYHVREPGADDRKAQLTAYGLVAGGTFSGNEDAARHMLHYLDGSGQPLTVDVDRMMRDDPRFRAHIEGLLSEKESEWRQTALDAYQKAGGSPVAIPVETERNHANDFTFDPEQQSNWFKAIGSQACVVSGVVTVKPGQDGKPVVSTQYQVNVWDRYNWDPGKSTDIAGMNITDADMAKLHQTGLAQEYDVNGRSTPSTWTGSGGSPVQPAGTGERNADRDGTVSDPGRQAR